MTECEDCGDWVVRRIRCRKCGSMVCPYCWHHIHGMEYTMADQKQDNGPYTLHGRRTEHEQEVRIGSYHDLGRARAEADDMVDTGIWHQATVRDKNDQTVHVGAVTGERDQKPDGPEPLPAA